MVYECRETLNAQEVVTSHVQHTWRYLPTRQSQNAIRHGHYMNQERAILRLRRNLLGDAYICVIHLYSPARQASVVERYDYQSISLGKL